MLWFQSSESHWFFGFLMLLHNEEGRPTAGRDTIVIIPLLLSLPHFVWKKTGTLYFHVYFPMFYQIHLRTFYDFYDREKITKYFEGGYIQVIQVIKKNI